MKPTAAQKSRAAQVTQARQLSIDDYLATLPPRTQDDDDTPRLNDQCLRVYRFMRDLRSHALAEISAATSDPQASVSARIREIRAYLEDRKRGDKVPGPAAKGAIIREKVPGSNGLHSYTMRLYRYSGAA